MRSVMVCLVLLASQAPAMAAFCSVKTECCVMVPNRDGTFTKVCFPTGR